MRGNWKRYTVVVTMLVLVCAVGIRKGAVGMVHLYSPEVQERCIQSGLTTRERIRKNSLLFKVLCLPLYIAYVLLCVYAVNGARGFLAGFWQLFVILSIMNLIDRFGIDTFTAMPSGRHIPAANSRCGRVITICSIRSVIRRASPPCSARSWSGTRCRRRCL